MAGQVRLDVLRPRVARWLLHRAWLPVAFQVVGLAGLVALLVNGWGTGRHSSPSELLMLRKTNLTTIVVWGLWWPSMILTAITLGRAWCTICPMELVSRLGRWAGRRAGWAALPTPRLARAGWLVIAAYLALQVLVAGLSIHRIPHATSLLLRALLAAAAGLGLVMREERAFCKTACPAKALLSVYGRVTPVQLDIRDADVCAACAARDCVGAEHREWFDHRSCPSLVRPFARQPGDECILCLQCAKVCPQGNIGVGLVAPSGTSRTARLLAPAEAAFVALATGFVAHEIVGEARTLEPWFHLVPEWMAAAAPAIGFGWWEALWFLAIFPAALWSVVWSVSRVFARGCAPRRVWLTAATAAAPVVAVAHAGKALAKLAAWAGYLPGALADPHGSRTLEALAGGTAAAPRRCRLCCPSAGRCCSLC
jgi:polyferredoxin